MQKPTDTRKSTDTQKPAVTQKAAADTQHSNRKSIGARLLDPDEPPPYLEEQPASVSFVIVVDHVEPLHSAAAQPPGRERAGARAAHRVGHRHPRSRPPGIGGARYTAPRAEPFAPPRHR